MQSLKHCIQIAGIKDRAEAELILRGGVDLLGFPFALPVNQEDISVDDASDLIRDLKIASRSVLITYLDQAHSIDVLANRLGCRWIQLHGPISLEELQGLRDLDKDRQIMKSLIIRDDEEDVVRQAAEYAPHVDAFISDSHDPITGADGATGRVHDWEISQRLSSDATRPLMLAGGLKPSNLEEAIRSVRPWAVDAHSGVEGSDGRKDRHLIEAFVQAARRGFAMISIALVLILTQFAAADSATPVRKQLNVATAANFRITLNQLAPLFEEKYQCEVLISSTSTGKLFAQIQQGAPFDVFLSADRRRPALLEEDELILPGSRCSYVLGQIALWWPTQMDSTAQLPKNSSTFRLAIGNPKTAPYGTAARQYMNSCGLDSLLPQVIRGESVMQAFQYVVTGQVDAAFVAYSLLLEHERMTGTLRGLVRLLSAEEYDPIVQQAVVLGRTKEPELSLAFLEFLSSPEAQAFLLRAGYLLPEVP